MKPPASSAPGTPRPGRVRSVNLSAVHGFSKLPALEIRMLAGLGVEGDAHCGTTVRHRFARRRNPALPNLRQVHLLGVELLADLSRDGHRVECGDLGENLTTSGVDLLGLPTGTVLRLGEQASVELTGLRTPCRLVDGYRQGLMRQLWDTDERGRRSRRAGVMAIVLTGGVVRADDPLAVVPPPLPHTPLRPV